MGFVIPSIFTAVDKFSGPVLGMRNSLGSLADRAAVTSARMDRSMKSIGDRARYIVGAASAVGASAVGLLGVAVKKAMDFETSLASFHTIVSDLNATQFDAFVKQIYRVGDSTRTAYGDVAASFEKIAGLNADFAKTADGLALISQAAITLSRASGDELGTSAENLVGIMNQFSLKAADANRAINVLAAGQAAGAATITQSAEAYKNFGSVAASANITLEQSQALIQTLGKFSLFGAEAGTKLRGSVLQLQKAGLGYKSGQFKINDALEEANKKLQALGSAKKQDAYLTKIFGAENITAGRILLTNINTYKDFTEAVTGTAEAQKQASIKSNTLAEKIQQAKAQFINLAVKIGTDLVPALSKLIDKIAPVIQGVVSWAEKNPGLAKTVLAVTAAVWLLNIALYANPITWVIALVVALIGIIVLACSHIRSWGQVWDDTLNWMKDVFVAINLALKLGWLLLEQAFMSMVDNLVRAWYWFENKVGLISDEQYKKNLAQIESEKQARIRAIRDVAAELTNTAARAALGPKFVFFDPDAQQGSGQEQLPHYVTAPVNPKLEQQHAQLQQMMPWLGQKQQLDINVKAAPGTEATVGNASSGLTPRVSSTMLPHY